MVRQAEEGAFLLTVPATEMLSVFPKDGLLDLNRCYELPGLCSHPRGGEGRRNGQEENMSFLLSIFSRHYERQEGCIRKAIIWG